MIAGADRHDPQLALVRRRGTDDIDDQAEPEGDGGDAERDRDDRGATDAQHERDHQRSARQRSQQQREAGARSQPAVPGGPSPAATDRAEHRGRADRDR